MDLDGWWMDGLLVARELMSVNERGGLGLGNWRQNPGPWDSDCA